MSPISTDRIERQILLRAPRRRVWRALTDSAEFGTWFGVKVEGPFAPGAHVRGSITHPGYEHVVFDIPPAPCSPWQSPGSIRSLWRAGPRRIE